MTERYPLRPIAPEEFEAFNQVPFEAFIGPEWRAESIEQERKIFEFDRSLAAFDGDAMVGSAAAFSFRLTVPGGAVGAGGVTIVSVLPSHRRRGILSAMMRAVKSAVPPGANATIICTGRVGKSSATPMPGQHVAAIRNDTMRNRVVAKFNRMEKRTFMRRRVNATAAGR